MGLNSFSYSMVNMVETKLLHYCGICKAPYETRKDALKCEAETKEFLDLVEDNPIAAFTASREGEHHLLIVYPPFERPKFKKYTDSISVEFGKLGELSIPSYEAFSVLIKPPVNIMRFPKCRDFSGTILRNDIKPKWLDYEREYGFRQDECPLTFIGKERIMSEADIILKKLDAMETGENVFGIIEALKRGEY